MNGANQAGTMADHPQCPQCGAPKPAGALEGLCPACLLRQGAATDSGMPPGPEPFEPPAVAEVARLFPQFEVLALIGKGGMGAVYRARQPALARLVALKILPPRTTVDSGFAERFTREARTLARLSHPNIVAVHEFGDVPNDPGVPAGDAGPSTALPPSPRLHYFVMEYVDGVNLRQLQQSGRLSAREALQIIPQICDALQYAHDEGVVHRDIKPENVLVDRKGRVKIADFGLAKILGHEPDALRLTGEGQVMGTPHYMAPEQVERPQVVDHRADIYSLGVVFYELLTGELPLGRFPPPSRRVQVDVRLDEVVLHALEKEPDRRYQQAGQVKSDVETITGTGGRAAPLHAPPGVTSPEVARTGPTVVRLLPVLAAALLPWLAAWGNPLAMGVVAGVALVAAFLVLRRPALRRGWLAAAVGSCLAASLIVALPRLVHSRAEPPNVTVTGVVSDAETGEPIAGARVSDHRYHTDTDRAPQEAWTDSEGRYALRTWYEEHTLAVSAPGYATKLDTLLTKPFRREREVPMSFRLSPTRAVPEGEATPRVETNGQLRVSFPHGSSMGEVARMEGRFPGLPLSRVREFRFDLRPFEWVGFRDVMLAPRRPTDENGEPELGSVVEHPLPIGSPGEPHLLRFRGGDILDLRRGPDTTEDRDDADRKPAADAVERTVLPDASPKPRRRKTQVARRPLLRRAARALATRAS